MWNLASKLILVLLSCSSSLVDGADASDSSGDEKNHLLNFMVREIEARKSGGDFVYMFRNRHELSVLFGANASNSDRLPSRAQEARELFKSASNDRNLNQSRLSAESLSELVEVFLKAQGQYKPRTFLVSVDIEARLAAIEVDGVREDGSGTRYWIFVELAEGDSWRVVDSKWILVWD